MKKLLFNTATLLCLAISLGSLPTSLNAAHIIGGEISYRFISIGKYEITLNLYQSCSFGEEGFDDPAYIAIYDGEGNLATSLPVAAMNADTLPLAQSDECFSAPATVCVQHMTYKANVILNQNPAGGYYRFAYQRFGRGRRLKNIEKPDRTGAVYEILLTKDAIDRCNSSPVFRNWPPMSVCADKPINFDHSASDSNDHKYDSLVYYLCTPLAGKSSKTNPQPIPPDNPPPFDSIKWLTPEFSANNPFGLGAGANDPIGIHPLTGIFSGTPLTKGEYLVGVCVEEYDRDSKKLLSISRRDFQMVVSECQQALSLEVGEGVCDDNLKTYSVEVLSTGTLTTDVGTFEEIGENKFILRGIPVNRSATVIARSNNSSCTYEATTVPIGCDCDDVFIPVPVSGGDKAYCVGSVIPILTATVSEGQTVDWYDAEVGGNLLATGRVFQPLDGGTFYAEARDETNSCASSERIPITLTRNEKPTFVGAAENIVCSEDLATYSITFTTTADMIQASAGNLVNNDGGSFTIKDIPAGINLNIKLVVSETNCYKEENIKAPDCSCESVLVDLPVSGGDQFICEGEPIPALSVMVPGGITVDWYGSAEGDDLLLSSNTVYVPVEAGIYYAEARQPTTNCSSEARTPVELSVIPNPTFTIQGDGAICAEDSETYSVQFNTNANNVEVSVGTLVNDGGGNYTISAIPAGINVNVSLLNSNTTCTGEHEITAPTCEKCPEDGLDAPVSGGDQMICLGDDMLPLSVTVDDGILVDWYDAPIQGTKLAEGVNTFIPDAPGVYYAEAVDPILGCSSNSRTAVRLILNELPNFQLVGDGVACADDGLTYEVNFFSNATEAQVSSGTVTKFGNTFQVTGVDITNNLVIELVSELTGCESSIMIEPPACISDCEDFIVPEPVSSGDKIICEGDEFPLLEVQVSASDLVDWYDAPTGGNLLAEATTTYRPTQAGIYYAEGRDINTNCVSQSRTPVALSVIPLPVFALEGEGAVCAEDKLTYSVSFSSDAEEVDVNVGDLSEVSTGQYLISNISIETNVSIILKNPSTGCEKAETVVAPDCSCPPDGDIVVVSGGDAFICEGDPMPALSATTVAGFAVDWYDAPVGGNLVQSASNSYTPTSGGIFYAEPRALSNNCPSGARVPVRLAINPRPSYIPSGTGPECVDNTGEYTVTFTSNADEVSANLGSTVNRIGATLYSIRVTDLTANLVITLKNTETDCERSETLDIPDCKTCEDVVINPPVSGGDLIICEGDPIPSLSVATSNGISVNWWSAPEGGTLVAQNISILGVSEPGTYYAESVDNATACTSNERTPVTLTIDRKPSYELMSEGAVCDPSRTTYSVSFTTDAEDIEISHGQLASSGGQNYTIMDVPINTNLEIRLVNASGLCENMATVLAPTCPCEDDSINPPLSGGDKIICEGDPIPSLVVTVDSGQSVNWYDAAEGGNVLKQGTDSFMPDGAGTYYAEAVDGTSSCPSRSRTAVTLIVEKQPTYDLSGMEPICSPTSGTYTVSFVSDADQLKVSAGTVTLEGETFTVSEVPIGVDLIVQLVMDANGCEKEISIPAPACQACIDTEVSVPVIGEDLRICEGEPLPELTATTVTGQVVDWYDQPTGGNLLLGTSNSFTPSGGGIYYAEARVEATGCVSTSRAAVRLTVFTVPDFNILGGNPTCAEDGKSFGFEFSTDGNDVSVSAGELVSSGDGKYTVNNITALAPVTVKVTSSAGCSNEIVVEAPNCPCIGINITPPEAVADTITTCGEEVAPGLEVKELEGQIIDWYDQSEGGNLLLANNRIFTPSEAGTYYAEARTNEDCVNNARTPVTWAFRAVPSYTALGEPECQPSQDYFDVAFLTDAAIVSVSAGELVEVGVGDYTVKDIPVGIQLRIDLGYEDDNCVRSEFISSPVCEAICEEPYVFIPNAFTPNGDNVNDYFRVRGEAIEVMKLMVYDRWGSEIFFAEDQSEQWDGTYKGEQLPPGVYAFYLTVECVGGSSYAKKGNVTLIR